MLVDVSAQETKYQLAHHSYHQSKPKKVKVQILKTN